MNEQDRDRHSVNCYFCGDEFDERDCEPADEYNGDDGGSICPTCIGNAELYRLGKFQQEN